MEYVFPALLKEDVDLMNVLAAFMLSLERELESEEFQVFKFNSRMPVVCFPYIYCMTRYDLFGPHYSISVNFGISLHIPIC